MTSAAVSSTSSHLLVHEDDAQLQVRGLNVFYGESHILRDVDLTVPGGKMVCLIGRNGVGKTTLLKTVMGLLRQRSGSVNFENREISALPPHRRARAHIGYVPQGREIIPQLTVRENLLLGFEALPGGMGRHRHIDPFIYELFPVLESFLERRGGDLSGGQQQQLAIARALLGKPRLLLLVRIGWSGQKMSPKTHKLFTSFFELPSIHRKIISVRCVCDIFISCDSFLSKILPI